MEKIYILTYHWDNEDNEGFEVVAVSKDLHRLNAIMRGDIEQSGVLADDMEEFWDKDETEPLDYNDPEQRYVCYSAYCSSCNYMKNQWTITETEVK